MSTESCCSTNTLALVYGALLLRLWLAVRAIQTGIEKYAGTKAVRPDRQRRRRAQRIRPHRRRLGQAIRPRELPRRARGAMKKFEAEPLMMKFAPAALRQDPRPRAADPRPHHPARHRQPHLALPARPALHQPHLGPDSDQTGRRCVMARRPHDPHRHGAHARRPQPLRHPQEMVIP